MLRVYLVTDPCLPRERGVYETARQALDAGVRTLQLRDKTATTAALIGMAARLRTLADEYGALFLINDRIDVALAVSAHGVHLGQDDFPPRLARLILGAEAVIGVSVRTGEEVTKAESAGADYLAANLVFATDTKTDIDRPLGLEGLRMLRQVASLPIVAIGGIGPENARCVIEAGADGVAVVSAIMAAPDVRAACRELIGTVSAATDGSPAST